MTLLSVFGSVLPAQEPAPPAGGTAGLAALPECAFRTRLLAFAANVPAAPKQALTKAELLRPELAFVARRRWLVLPTLAKQLTDDEEQRKAVRELLETGAKELRTALAAEGADQDLGAIAALCVQQLWQLARDEEVAEAAVDTLHAQLVQWLAGPEVAAMTDADKQRCWEVCAGYPTFVAAMVSAVDNDEQRTGLRKVAAAVFEALIGVAPDQVQIGRRGFVVRKKPRAKPAEDAAAAVPTAPPAAQPTAPPAAQPPAAATGTVAVGAAPLPASGPAIDGVVWKDPAGWQKQADGGSTVFRATLCNVENDGRPEPNDTSTHQAAIGFLPVQTASRGPTELFDRLWREQFAQFELGDTAMHYRGRLPSQLVVLYMGRFFRRPNTPSDDRILDTYGALWLIDLGGNRFQPLVAVVEPRDPSLGMPTIKQASALQALSFPLAAVLDSIRPKRGKPPYPTGGYFAAEDLRGRWRESSGALGASYYNTVTGGFAGVAMTSAAGKLELRTDGTYYYDFAYSSTNPQFGNSGGSIIHEGRYRLDGDVVLVEPTKPLPYPFTCCAVGIGVRQTNAGPRRILMTVSGHRDGGFRQVPLIPNGTRYDDSVLTFYIEGG